MKQVRIIGIIALLLFDIQPAFTFFKPEKYFFKNIHLKDGLSQCVVTGIAVDKRGFIWASTFDGLNRFDGNNIKIFRNKLNDSSSILSSKIFNIISDENGHLYLFTNDGFCIFNCLTERIVRPEILRNGDPRWVGQHDATHVWFYLDRKGFYLVNTQDFSYQQMPNSALQLFGKERTTRFFEVNHKLYSILSNGSVVCYDQQLQTSKRYSYGQNTENSYIYSELTKDGTILISHENDDLVYFDVYTGKFARTDFYSKQLKLIAVNRMKYDSANNLLYLGTYGQGLFVYEYDTKELRQFKKGNSQFPLSSNYINAICVDKFGLMYVGFDGMGFDVMDPFIKKFSPITYIDSEEKNTLRYVRKIIEDDRGHLLIGTSESGLVRYHLQTGKFDFYNFQMSEANVKEFIIEMIRDGDNLWLGYNNFGVCIVDIHTLQIKRKLVYGTGANNLSAGSIWSFLKKDGHMWVGTRANGLNKVNLDNWEVTKYDENRFPEFANNGVRCLYTYKTDELLIGTEEGVFIFNTKSEKLRKVFPLRSSERTFKTIKSIHRDQKQRFWLATDGGGVAVLDTQYKMIRNFSTEDGISNNVVYGILRQNDTSYWMSSNAGICNLIWNEASLTPGANVKTRNYDELNGLQSNEFNTAAFALLHDGRMAFGGLNGINVFHPKEIVNNLQEVEVYFTEFKIFENSLESETSMSNLSKVDLKYFENSFSISFSTLGLILPQKTNYQYRLVGYDSHWIQAKNRNYVSYTNLRSGTYEFQVKASNYDGVWSDKYTTLTVSIATPFFKSWWFYLLLALVVCAFIYSVYRFRSRQMEEKERLKLQFTKEIAQLEMKALRAQINPHFIFNSLNSINNYVLKNDTKLASKYLIKFSQLIRSILNNSSNAFITLEEELNTLKLYMLIEGMRFSNQFSFHIDIDPSLNTAVHFIPSLLLQPYVENAIWHGLLHKEGYKSITISLKRIESDSIRISIEDNGVGLQLSQQYNRRSEGHSSFGMKLGESRLSLLMLEDGQSATVKVVDLFDEEGNPRGTRIEIVIPTKLQLID
ncbi:MAG: histidine kinase [Bacteroidetes bacterium]|nr:histidine kinase [Bacteroidota bacterium]